MKLLLEYIWLDVNQGLRSKTKVMVLDYTLEDESDTIPIKLIPEWNYDGSSTGQGSLHHSEVIIRPVVCYKDPFRKTQDSFLVLCETFNIDGTPHSTNTRHIVAEYFNKPSNVDLKPLFGLEQEFFMINPKTGKPIGFPENNTYLPTDHGNYYCGVGETHAYGRKYMEKIMKNLLYMNLSITGMNLEVAPGQGEFQVCDYGIKAADQLIMMRYVIQITLEKYHVMMDINPKLKTIDSSWNGSGCHTNFSTIDMMNSDKGYKTIYEFLDRMSSKHNEHIEVYGEGNEKRLTGKNETSSIKSFSYGVGSRGCSIRIPYKTEQDKCGYIEDRRPASNMDPYKVIYRILATYNGDE